MTAPITPGWYAVEVTLVPDQNRDGQQMAYVASPMFSDWRIPADCLHPFPAATISAEAQAVIDTSLAGHRTWVEQGRPDEGECADYWKPHIAACDALIASITPPDPVAELVALLRQHFDGPYEQGLRQKIYIAIAAVEAARGGK